MVVSKDSKRKRKESTPPQALTIESSPEMPKRTKVQAQRKFAQGQSAPCSSYTATIAASSSSTTGGPSASSESREPPTEILPNKRPKTEDFLTFLCFRGTSALPAHLDFLNQGKGEESQKPIDKKKKSKLTAKTQKKQGAKRGRKAKGAKAKAGKKDEPVASTSAAAAAELLAQRKATTTDSKTIPIPCDVNDTRKRKSDNPAEQKNTLKSCNPPEKAVSGKHSPLENDEAEQIEHAKLPSRSANEKLKGEEKPSKPPENKRRSNRNGAKDTKYSLENENNENDDDASTSDAPEQKAEMKDYGSTKKSKTSATQSQSSTPTKESDSVSKGRRGKVGGSVKKLCADNKDAEVEKESTKGEETGASSKAEQQLNKTKQIAKRSRQKESPIFIPSPEPTGRMTRQRAFFEPVKVIPVESEPRSAETDSNKATETMAGDVNGTRESAKKLSTEIGRRNLKNSKICEESKNLIADNTVEEKKNALNVFDFSSDDEQPLSKAINLKKGTTQRSPKKLAQAAKRRGKKLTPKKSEENVTLESHNKEEIETKKEVETGKKTSTINLEPTTAKNKRSVTIAKKKQDVIESFELNDIAPEKEEDEVIDTPTLSSVKKKTTNFRQQRKTNKPKSDLTSTLNSTGQHEENPTASPPIPSRNQRPSRKTKEAAAIYMGIIGHKLQQNEDEDDDMSLNSFPDLPNVKEMEKMESELKKNATSAVSSPTTVKSPTKITAAVIETEKQVAVGRRGRPPKQGRAPPLPVKREIEGMLVKKGSLTKAITQMQSDQSNQNKEKQHQETATRGHDSDDEDFLINEEVNETKRKLEKSFSDSDDEPLAVKVNLKSSDKDMEEDSKKSDCEQHGNVELASAVFPTGVKPLAVSGPVYAGAPANAAILTATAPQSSQPPTSFLKTVDKKSPVPNSKILNVPAAFNLPSTTQSTNAFISKMEHKLISPNLSSSYLPPASPHYHALHQTRPPTHSAIQTVKSPTQPPPLSAMMPHIAAPPPPPQSSPLKYQTPPTTYPPPIEAYPSPKINPNFLTPKFDRSSLPRTNSFPSPSPIKFDLSSTPSKTVGLVNSTMSPKPLSALQTLPGGANAGQVHASNPTAPAAAGAGSTANASTSDPLKDEIGSILAANLMPSKEESGKIFGIASVSLAQSSGPDNTKCTLGKCGSIHKPVLGPVVPTEGYIGDQLSSKERRKAKVNMTHEQIQKWLIECSSNPDEIQDDMDDDYDDNLRPNLFATTPPPTRDDKESTSFSSSSKATRDLGKSESAWSGKGPSLKAIPVVATTSTKDDPPKNDFTVIQQLKASPGNETPQVGTMPKGTATSKHSSSNVDNKSVKEKVCEKKSEKKSRDEKAYKDTNREKEAKHTKAEKDKEHAVESASVKTAAAGKQSSTTVQAPCAIESNTAASATKQNRKKNTAIPAATDSEEKIIAPKSATSVATNATPKRTPVYNQKATQKHVELKETTTTSHKKKSPFSYNFGAFSVDNEKSIYSFDKDDDEEGVNTNKPMSKPVFRRQSRQDSQTDEAASSTITPRPSPVKKRNVLPPEKPHKDAANAPQSNSVSLTLSPSENCKLVKVSLEAEQQPSPTSKTKSGKLKSKMSVPSKPTAEPTADSDSEGHTFYIPLQGTGAGGSAEGGIQGVAVKLGREGPEGPNQKVIMHATLVTKAQMGQNSKPLPDSVNASEIVKNLLTGSSNAESLKKSTTASTTGAVASTSAAAAINSASSSSASKSVPVGTVQPRFKGAADSAAPQPSTSTGAASGSGLVRVNSNSSLFSGSAKSRHGTAGTVAGGGGGKKFKDDTPIKMSNNTAFPRHDDPTQMVEAPIFRPTEKEFSDPIDFIERITPIAARFGICKIVPPATFKPECRISDEMRFTAYNQYVHKMLHRWGPSAKELSAIKKYLATQSIVMNHPPWIGGMEVDLPRLYHTVQELGGLKEVIEKKKWARVAEEMCIPKLAQDRVTKLDDIYCKYLLPYDTLSPTERQKLFDEVEADWAKREARARRNADRFVNTESVSNEEDDVSSDDDEESEEEVDGVSMECIVKGRSMPLSQFYRIARNTMTLWFKNTEPTVNEVEAEFWRHVAVRDSHVCVHSGSIDSSGWGYGFPTPGPKGKGSNYARHPWNLKVLTNNSGSVLRSLGPVMGVTVPTLHVGMLFSACCWYRDPHGLSWIEYLHTGASKLWYGIPDDQSANFRAALTALIPTHCQNKTIWLPCDTVMVPPHMLTDRGVSLCRIEQKPGEFIVVFPRAYTSSLATGYVVSESVYFATNSWLDLAKDDFRDIHDSCEPAMFSLEQLLFALGSDQRVSSETMQQMLPMLNEVFEKETAAREQLKAAGVTSTEKVPSEKGTKSKKQHPVKSIESECDLCRANLYISMVRTDEGNVYCLQHALKNLNNGNIQAKQCKLIFAYNIEDVENLIKNLKDKIQQKRIGNSNKKTK